CESVLRVEINRMRVRTLLPLWIDARALVLDEGAGRLEAAVGIDRQADDAAAAVIGRQRTRAAGVDRHMTRTGAAGRLLVDQSQRAAIGINGKGADAAGLFAVEVADFPHGVEELLRRVDFEERGVDRFGGQSRRAEFARRQ